MPASNDLPSQPAPPLILVVEDAPDNQVLVEQVFQDSGYLVTCIQDGQAALDWLEVNHPDLILLDLSLPEVDGWEIARQLKASDRTFAIPIIALTAHAMKGDREAAIASGCDDYLTKPIDIDLLESVVTQWLNKPKSLSLG
ncbi:response regulator [Pseudanabaena sp. FACHB-1277]|jgi:two-component system cell cycle response regulator DivK|uniref:Response regulator n=1 Tax=Pseudanabaena cinerea FACHB-1277 TaxID=2949581 RepID=A0A926Z7U5_9CYAN|nr:response regulator [Pseudanabaena cinerea]MBD2152028.1 response regulator [Pseudanabaena cinerea FACHB-1277]